MNNKLRYLIILFSIPGIFLAQSKGKQPTFQEIKTEREAYFEKQKKVMGDQYLENEGGEYKEYQRWLRLWEPRIAPDGTVDDYIKRISTKPSSNLTQKIQPGMMTTSFSDPWTELGPFNKPTSGESNIGGGERGVGPIQYFAFYKPNPNIMLATSLAGGLFYSNNKGVTWANAGSDNWTISGCMSAAFSPISASTWYGCSNLGGDNNRHGIEKKFAIGPGGVWRTVDAGVSYTLIADQFDFALWGMNTTIHKILIDPSNASVGYVATTGGLYKSINITAPNPTWFTIQTGNIEDIEFKTDNSNVIFLTRQQTYAPASSGWNQSNDWVLEVSTNWGGTSTTGGTWTDLLAPTGGFIANTSFPGTRSEPGNLEMATTEADPNLIYLQDLQYSGPSAKILTYDYNLTVWTIRQTLYNSNFGTGRVIGASNTNAAVVYIGKGLGFNKSTNYGATDIPIATISASTNYHVDIETVIAPPYYSTLANGNDVFIATHGGASYSNDACATVASRSNGLGVAESWGWSQTDQKQEKMVMGLDHDGTVMSDIAGIYPNLSWQTVYGCDGMPAYIDQANSNYVYVACNWSNYLFSSTGGNAGTYSASTILNTNEYGIAQNKILTNYLYFKKKIGSFVQLFRSNDNGISNGEQITIFSNSTPYNYLSVSQIQEIATSPSNSNYLYVDIVVETTPGAFSHRLFRNTNVNALATTVQSSWVELISPVSGGMGASAIDQFDPNIIYISQWGGAVYKCDYTNVSSPIFTTITYNLPPMNGPPARMRFEKGSNSGLYIATRSSNNDGVWYTNASRIADVSIPDKWVKLSALPNAPIEGMEINYSSNKLRVSTAGRGVWEHDLICPTATTITFAGPTIAANFYEANYITATTTNLATVNPKICRATKSVTLNTGFVAQPTGTNNYFLAFIHGCSSSGNTLKLMNDSEDLELENLEAEKENEEESISDSKTMQIFPNPNNGSFTLSSSTDEEKEVIVYDMMGNVVYLKKKAADKNISIDISSNPKGMYVIKITTGNKVVTKKIISQ